jgi:3-deoxy-D-manno-octulosonic-acid transferase
LSAAALPDEPFEPAPAGIAGRAAIALYAGLTRLGTPLIKRHVARRRRAGKEHETRWPERFGVAGAARPAGVLVWLHAASVGEAMSALPLIVQLRAAHPEIGLLLTTGTVTSASLLASRLPDGVLHQFVPVDLPRAIDRFLDHWRPDLVLWLESELWPNLLRRTARRGVPLILVNGRLSAASHARWRFARPLVRALLGSFALLLAQSEADAARLGDLAGRSVRCLGNLKRAGAPLPADDASLVQLRDQLGGRGLWLAASTHPGEEAIAAAVHRRVAAAHPGLVTVIVPRHPARGPAIQAELVAAGLAVARRAGGDALPASSGVYLADTLGELGLWYRLASIVFIGGSLVPHGGQNPLEPARLGCALVYGPAMTNFADIAAELAAAGAAEIVPDADALGSAIARLLADGPRCAATAEAGRRYAEAQEDVAAAVAATLEPALRRLVRG